MIAHEHISVTVTVRCEQITTTCHMQGSPRPKVKIAAADGAERAAVARGLQMMWCCEIHG